MEKIVDSGMNGLSNLPEHIIHHIMSLLPIEDAIHMSILSKTLHSSWLSFPIMNLDCSDSKIKNCFRDRPSDSSFHFLENYLQNLNTCLQKLRLSGGCGDVGDSDLDEAKINRMINFSIQNNVRELELDFGYWINKYCLCKNNYCLTPAIFDAKSIKILTLKGLKSVSLDLVFSSPCLENLSLIGCIGFKTITLASNAKLLKALKIDGCSDLNDIHFESTAVCLESFSCRQWLSMRPVKFNISSSTAPNLKHLMLQCQSILDGWIKSNFSEFRNLQTLKIEDSYGFATNKMIKFHLENLKTLEFQRVDYGKVEIQAPNMVSFTYGSYLSAVTPEIDISSTSSNLKHVEFHGQFVDTWVDNNFSQFRTVETLEFNMCSTLKNIKIHFDYLKCLKFVSCKNLSGVEIEAPNLVSFIYEGGGDIIYAPQVIINSKAKLDVKLDFSYKCDRQHNISLRNFLERFGQHCQTLTLSCKTCEYIDAEWLCLRPRSLPPPLYKLKHLKVQLGSLTYLTSVLDAWLWLAPHPNIISFIVGSRVKSLMFHYKNENVESWVQDLKECTMENFERSEKTSLEDYFRKFYNSAVKAKK